MPPTIVIALILAGAAAALVARRRRAAPPPAPALPQVPAERRPAATRDVEPGVIRWLSLPEDPAAPGTGPLRVPLKRSTDAAFPMPGPVQLDAAERVVGSLERALLSERWGPAYLTRNPDLAQAVRDFQELMNLLPDGKYGPRAAGAIMFLTGRPPPAPWFAEPRTVVAYEPEGAGSVLA